MKQLHPDWTPAEIKAALMATAVQPSSLDGFGVMARGSGAIDLSAAVQVQTLVSPGSVSFGRIIRTGPASLTKTITIRNTSAASADYSLTVGMITSSRNVAVTFESSSVSLPPGGSKELLVTITIGGETAPGQTDVEGFIAISDQGTTIPGELRIPFWARVVQ
jgi:minor extracellular serine protease Vpr